MLNPDSYWLTQLKDFDGADFSINYDNGYLQFVAVERLTTENLQNVDFSKLDLPHLRLVEEYFLENHFLFLADASYGEFVGFVFDEDGDYALSTSFKDFKNSEINLIENVFGFDLNRDGTQGGLNDD